MIAKMKCSNCGAEMSNLNFSWGKKYWLFMIPVMLLGFLPLMKMMFFKGDATKDLVISEIQKRVNGPNIDVIGLITNSGSHKWSSITVEAEFFDSAGVFVDEQSEYLRSDIPPAAKEHFKFSWKASDPKLLADDIKMIVKVAGGHSMPF